ncbi:toll-like receptor 2 type-1 [Babylonia areolata]|uniref:toll-like receptor 2 type-1 n=1 Tax=Babylonia areolata TaxID=304850 RepID=UPI003FD4F603
MARAPMCLMWWLCCLIFTIARIYGGTSEVVGPFASFHDVTGVTDSPESPCGDHLCRCRPQKADCSGHRGKLTYVPKLPDDVVSLDLSGNSFTSDILTSDFFANVTHVFSLDLSRNNITWLPRSLFRSMEKLNSLCLNENKALLPESLREVVSIRTLGFVRASGCNLPPPSADLFKNTTTSSLYRLTLNSNPHGGTYNLEGLCPLESVHQLYLAQCDFKQISSSCPLLLVSTLDLSGNTLRGFPRTCLEQGRSMFPSLMFLALRHNRIEELSTADVCLPSLRTLDMSFNFVKMYPTGTFSSLKFPFLEKLRLQHQASYWDMFKVNTKIRDHAFDNPNLKELDLRQNELEFADRESIGQRAFANCHNLRDLYLSSNNFSDVNEQRFLSLFGHMKSLTTLLLSNNKFEVLTTKTFANFQNLAILHLDNNIITSIPDGAFDGLERLSILILSNNKIKTIDKHAFSENTRSGLRALTLGMNPFQCSCELLWFQHWFLTDQKLFSGRVLDESSYTCQNIPQMALANFSMIDQACLLSREVSLFIIQACSVVIATLVLVSLVFRFRWHIRLLMYEVFRGRDDLRAQRLLNNNFDYDVFVSYASEDLLWVRQQLMPKLENELGLRLCIHERDFLLGKNIVDNIVESVDSSKKILMVFSADFVRSQWCQFELNMCLSHVMDHDDALIVVCVDDVISRQMTSAMMAVLKTTTYIQWQVQDDAVASFWGRLHLALNEILPQREHYV